VAFRAFLSSHHFYHDERRRSIILWYPADKPGATKRVSVAALVVYAGLSGARETVPARSRRLHGPNSSFGARYGASSCGA